MPKRKPNARHVERISGMLCFASSPPFRSIATGGPHKQAPLYTHGAFEQTHEHSLSTGLAFLGQCGGDGGEGGGGRRCPTNATRNDGNFYYLSPLPHSPSCYSDPRMPNQGSDNRKHTSGSQGHAADVSTVSFRIITHRKMQASLGNVSIGHRTVSSRPFMCSTLRFQAHRSSPTERDTC